MCSKGTGSRTGDSGSGGAQVTPLIHRQELAKLIKKKEPNLVIVDVSERNEPRVTGTKPSAEAINVPLGELLRNAGMEDAWKEEVTCLFFKFSLFFPKTEPAGKQNKGKLIVTFCQYGYRGVVAARELVGLGFNAKALEGGYISWINPAAASFDQLVTLGYAPTNIDKLNTALAFAVASVKNGNTTALALMGDGVYLGIRDPEKGGLRGDEHMGPPFEPVAALLKTFLEEGGLVFVCHTCTMARKLDYSMMHPWVNKGTAPDVIRGSQNAKGTLQFM